MVIAGMKEAEGVGGLQLDGESQLCIRTFKAAMGNTSTKPVVR